MKSTTRSPLLAGAICLAAALAGSASGADRVKEERLDAHRSEGR